MTTDRSQSPSCPRCGQPLSPLGAGRVCRGCRGAWVPEDRLAEMVRTMRNEVFTKDLEFTPRSAHEAALRCPACDGELAPETFADQPVDRCAEHHGVWLDDGELSGALRGVAKEE